VVFRIRIDVKLFYYNFPGNIDVSTPLLFKINRRLEWNFLQKDILPIVLNQGFTVNN
jgi:hypothetical protein